MKMKQTPKATDLEELVLGAMLVDSKGLVEAMPVLKNPSMFYDARHCAIFQAIAHLYGRNEAVDMVTVAQRLKETKELEKVGGEYYLIQLTQKVATSAHIDYHARIIVQHWVKREIIRISDKFRGMAYDDGTDVFDLMDGYATEMDGIQEAIITGGREINYPEELRKVVKRVELITNKEDGEVTGVPTGFKKIDAFTGGWQAGDLIIVAGRPGMGKTAFMLKNVVECGLRGIPAGIISLEMSAQQLAARTVSINSNFHLSQLLRDGFEKQDYFTTLIEVMNGMERFPLYIDDTASMDIKDIITRARMWHRKHDIKVLFVDYIQLATDKTKKSNREQEIASISRNLKVIAKELKIPVIALSQLSRKVEERRDKRPNLADIRESGAIEQDADIVAFLYRPEYYNPDDIPEHLLEKNANAEFNFAKYRQGSLGTKALYFDSNKVKYMDPSEREDHTTTFETETDDLPY